MQKDLILREFEDLKSAVNLLKASVKKYVPYNSEKIYAPNELEYYDSFSFRFEKTIELMLNFFKGLEIFLYSTSSDTLRDRLLIMQKIKIVDNIEFWMEARLLRNKIAHAYLPQELKDIYDEITNKSHVVFESFKKIEKHIKKL